MTAKMWNRAARRHPLLVFVVLASSLEAACSGTSAPNSTGAGGSSASAGAGTSGSGGPGLAGAGGASQPTSGGGGSSGASIVLGPEPQPSPDLTLAVFQMRFGELRCRQLANCCDASFDVVACSAQAYEEWAARALPAGNEFNIHAAAYCLQHLAAADCRDRDYLYCRGVYQPMRKRGESCNLTHRCEPSLAGDVHCLDGRCVLFWERMEDETCVGEYMGQPGSYPSSYSLDVSVGRQTELALCPERKELQCAKGRCVQAAACDADTCSEDEYCDRSSKRCAARPRAGEVATGPCYEGYADPETGRCVPLTGDGDACVTATSCESGYCATSSQCEAPNAEFCQLGS